jgi:hypothetical protein
MNFLFAHLFPQAAHGSAPDVITNRIRHFLEQADGAYDHFTPLVSSHLLLNHRKRTQYAGAGERLCGYIEGYIRITDGPGERSPVAGLDAVASGRWPLDGSFSGSFAVFVLNREQQEATIANDPIGVYPLYYYQNSEFLIISSHVTAVAAIAGAGVDEIGVVQRLLPPDYCTFGRRTIARGVCRLLPGEHLTFRLEQAAAPQRRYDNTLYNGVEDGDIRQVAETTWNVVQEELQGVLNTERQVAMGMSGGMDSRLLLAAVRTAVSPPGVINCLTYGNAGDYEVGIARRCAAVAGAAHRSFAIDQWQFPDRELMREYALATEAVAHNVWLPVLEESHDFLADGSLFLVGDLCETIPGREIGKYNSRQARVRTFLRSRLFRSPPHFEPALPERFAAWKRARLEGLLAQVRPEDLSFWGLQKAELEQALAEDIGCLFERIASHPIAYVELWDELFGWYTHRRMAVGRQLPFLGKRFRAISPMMSLKVMRYISRVHPRLRLHERLMDQLFRLEALRPFSAIPTAQVPFLPYRTAHSLKLLVWGARSTADQWLIKRMMRKRDPSRRYRVLQSLNWPQIYQNRQAAGHASAWFEPDLLQRRQEMVTLVKQRATLEQFPLTNFDILSLAGLNLEVEYLSRRLPSA